MAIGVIRTEKAKPSEHLLSAEDGAQRGAVIRRALVAVMRFYRPVVAVQEANGGSKSALAAAALTRAQQACSSAVEECIGSLPLFVTPQSMQKTLTGHKSAGKDEIEAVVRKQWAHTDFDALLSGVAPGKRENAFDACGIGLVGWDLPQVTAARRLVG